MILREGTLKIEHFGDRNHVFKVFLLLAVIQKNIELSTQPMEVLVDQLFDVRILVVPLQMKLDLHGNPLVLQADVQHRTKHLLGFQGLLLNETEE